MKQASRAPTYVRTYTAYVACWLGLSLLQGRKVWRVPAPAAIPNRRQICRRLRRYCSRRPARLLPAVGLRVHQAIRAIGNQTSIPVVLELDAISRHVAQGSAGLLRQPLLHIRDRVLPGHVCDALLSFGGLDTELHRDTCATMIVQLCLSNLSLSV